MLDTTLTNSLPPPQVVRATIGSLLRELQIARGILRLSKLAEEQRKLTPAGIANTSKGTPSTSNAR